MVYLDLEGEPVVRVAGGTDVGACRLGDWAEQRRDELHEAVDRAIELALRECPERAAA